MKKRLLALFLCAALTLSLAACATPAPDNSPSQTPSAAAGQYKPGTYTATGEGKNGPVELKVTFTADAIEKIEIGAHTETAGISDPVFQQYPAAIVAGQTLAVDTIAGATITCDAVLAAVADAVTEAGGDPAALKTAAAGSDSPVEQAELSTDVVVVGAGSAGALAAMRLAEQGKSVILLEKMAFIGGSSAACGGGLFIAGTEAQKAAGLQDDPDAFTQALMDNGHGKNTPELAAVYANYCGPMVDWLEDSFNLVCGYDEFTDAPYGHYNVPGGGAAFMQSVKEILDREEKITLMVSTEAKELILTDGVVTGVKAVGGDKEYTINGAAVILATGGFSCNEEMLAGNLPEHAINYGPTYLTGDGHTMAMAVGGALMHPEWIALKSYGIETEPGVGLYAMAQGQITAKTGAILVNQDGVRVVKEEASEGEKVAAHLEQEDQSLYLVMDQAGYDIFRVSGEALRQYTPEVADGWLADDKDLPVLVKGDTLADAATAAGVDGASLTETVTRYNGMVAEGTDADFGHAVSVPLATEGPIYIWKMNIRYCQTLGGMAANEDLQLLNEAGEPIPGLYGAGEMVGGAHGDKVLSLLAWAMASGYRVGDTVGATIK